MSARTPIEPSDIRKGDLVRVEFDTDRRQSPEAAIEYVAPDDRVAMARRMDKLGARDRHYYLLDRPTPPVELPSEPTLGWIDQPRAYRGGRTFGCWKASTETPATVTEYDARGERVNQWYRVDSFTPAVAVPKAALDELRACAKVGSFDWRGDVADFLDAVDAANGATS